MFASKAIFSFLVGGDIFILLFIYLFIYFQFYASSIYVFNVDHIKTAHILRDVGHLFLIIVRSC